MLKNFQSFVISFEVPLRPRTVKLSQNMKEVSLTSLSLLEEERRQEEGQAKATQVRERVTEAKKKKKKSSVAVVYS